MSVLFGKYQPLANLGQGGMADVYLAVARGPVGFSKLQVVKRLRSNLVEEPEFLDMFLDEARLAARLNHPNVVQTNEIGESNGRYYMAMEYLEGQPLNRIQQRTADKPLPLAIRLTVLTQALAGLHHAHELTDYDGSPLEVVHRDVSPHNIFVTYDGVTKLVDFGIAKAARRASDTRAGILKGKVAYMSPEQAMHGAVDRRSDLFSIGVILWELITGRRFWDKGDDVQIVQKLVAGEFPNLSEASPDVPPELLAICERALAFKADARYPTAAALRDDIDAFVEKNLPKVGEKDVSRAVIELFAEERAEIKAIIEKRLKGVTVDGTDIPRVGAEEDEITASVPRLLTGATRTPAGASGPGSAEVAASRTASAVTPGPRRVPALVIAAALAIVGGGILLGLRRAPAADGAAAASTGSPAVTETKGGAGTASPAPPATSAAAPTIAASAPTPEPSSPPSTTAAPAAPADPPGKSAKRAAPAPKKTAPPTANATPAPPPRPTAFDPIEP